MRSETGWFIVVILLALVARKDSNCRAESLVCEPSVGPVLYLDYARREQYDNKVEAFMYFVPLISPTGVQIEIDPKTKFSAGVINRAFQVTGKNTFKLICDFDVYGTGWYRVVYTSKEMIDFVRQRHPNEKHLTKLLDWIQVDGPCQGQIIVLGRKQQQDVIIEQMTISFVRGETKSPVKTCIYDLPCVNDHYDYAYRSNVLIARVNALTFRRTETSPRMSVQIGSVVSENASEGWFSAFSAILANFLLPAQPVSVIGNQTMLQFGKALYFGEPEFVFPEAQTIRGYQWLEALTF